MQQQQSTNNPMIPPTTTTTSRKRRRAIATSCLSIATLLLTSSTLLVVESTTATSNTNDEATSTNDEQQQQIYTKEEMTKHHTNNHYQTITKWKRSLSSSSTSLSSLSSSTSSSRASFNYKKLRPLDLVIDNTDTNKHSPRVYQVGIYGQLEPYNEKINYEKYYVGHVDLSLFTTSSSVEVHSGSAGGDGEEAKGDSETKTTRENTAHNKKPIGKYTRPAFRNNNDDNSHYQSKRLGMSNFDKRRGIGIDEGEKREEEAVERRKERELVTRGLRGAAVDESENVDGKEMLFPYTAENDPWELEEDELFDDGRLLSSANTFASHHGKSSSSHADDFQNSYSKPPMLPSKEKGGTTSKKQQIQQKVSQAPIISSTFPPPDVHIGKHQTFGATVYGVDNGGVEQQSINAKVCVQFQDAHGGRSTCFDLDRVDGHKDDSSVDRDKRELLNCAKKKHKDHPRCKNKQDQVDQGEDTDGSINLGGGEQQQVQQEEAIIHEKIFEGFQAFSGQNWKFRIRAVNNDKVRVMSQWQKFTISEYLGQMPEEEEEEIEGEESTTSSTVQAPPSEEEEEDEVESAPPAPPTKLLEEVRDEDWPHGGKFEAILF